jgi:hypothetical protein
MRHNAKIIMQKDNQFKLVTKVWQKIVAFAILNHWLLEYIKLAKINTIPMLGYIKNEQTFNIVSFMKNELRNKFNTHLSLCTRFNNQCFFTMQIFSYEQTIIK